MTASAILLTASSLASFSSSSFLSLFLSQTPPQPLAFSHTLIAGWTAPVERRRAARLKVAVKVAREGESWRSVRRVKASGTLPATARATASLLTSAASVLLLFAGHRTSPCPLSR